MDTRIETNLAANSSNPILSSEIIQAVLADPPRKSSAIQAELLFLDGYYIFHRQDKNLPVADIYKCVSPAALQTAFSHEPIDTGWMQPGIVRYGTGSMGTYLIKFIPPATYLLDCDEVGTLKTPLPAMIFMGIETKYWVWTIKGKTLDPKAFAFHTPLPNIYNSGQVCWGVNEPPDTSPQTINMAWNLFISSLFTSHLATGKSKSHSDDVRQQLLKLHQQGKRFTYPASNLMPIGNKKSVDALVQEILDERNQ
ncbi:hypothetical protein C7B61_00860 [filamentous cyanobacterium CCP1]|nr:hypothetical protein C7B76_00340 [filamentous cyanobacterium CCP2]PSB68437.1 hypothetical protein C7B61_00860 [filamentous cyanobacterium CCP1]